MPLSRALRSNTWKKFFALASLAAAAGCTFLVKNDTDQCSSNADCVAKGPAFEGTICGASHTCVTDPVYCSNNKACIDRVGSATVICQRPEHRCVQVTSKECPTILAEPADLANDNAFIVGAIGLDQADSTPNGVAAVANGISLARQDFGEIAKGVLDGGGRGFTSPVVILMCDHGAGDADAHTEVDHLINDLRSQMLIGPFTKDALTYATSKAIPAHTVIVTPAYGGDELTATAGRAGLFFRYAPSFAGMGTAQAKLVPVVEDLVRTRGATGTVKVAAVFADDPASQARLKAFKDAVSFNSAPLSGNTGAYLDVSVHQAAWQADLTTAAQAVAAFAPNIIVVAGSPALAGLVDALEPLYSTGTYIFDEQARQPSIVQRASTDALFRLRVLGLQPGRPGNAPEMTRYSLRYGVKFPKSDPTSLSAASFDLVYLAGLGLAGASFDTTAGDKIGQALLGRVTNGTLAITTQETSIQAALQQLAAGQGVNIDGTPYAVHFDANGDLTGWGASVYCVKVPSGKATFGDTGLTYSSQDSKFTGTNTCFQ